MKNSSSSSSAVANWTDSSGEGYLVRIPSANLQIHARSGLLHEGLYGFG